MNKILFSLITLFVSCNMLAQNPRNYIQPIDEDGFTVDSIISIKGNMIEYIRAGIEFDIAKNKVAYIEHSQLGRIDINASAELKIPEPDFNGDAFICNLDDNTYIKTEKCIGQVKVKDQLMGPEKKLYVKPNKSPVRIHKGNVNILIRVPDINEDPYAFIKVSKFSVGATRKLSLARQNEITGKVTYGGYNDQELKFTAKKYGNSSLLISVNINTTGEYCITISNPNNVDSKLTVACFGVDE